MQKRIKAIKIKVDILERLHKTCQLTEIGIAEPILNESRYLARALADILHYSSDSTEYAHAVHTAELAVHSAINDAVDILITFTKSTLQLIEKKYPEFKIAVSFYGKDYVDVLKAIETIDGLVVGSRGNRVERFNIYQKLADDHEGKLSIIASFALKLSQIEAAAQIKTYGSISDGLPKDADPLFRVLEESLSTEGEYRLWLAFQPKYEKINEEFLCVGAEALVRLKNTTSNSVVPPFIFIQTMEQSGLIHRLGKFVLEEVLKVLRDDGELPPISINVSPLELLRNEYSDDVIKLVDEYGRGLLNRLEFEITESAAINDLVSLKHLEKLSSFGCKFAIDDFGTGETKFGYLGLIDISVIKIDQSLVQSYESAPMHNEKIIRAIIAISEACGTELVVEGVENIGVVNNLIELGASKFQGYHFGRPVTLDEFRQEHLSSSQ